MGHDLLSALSSSEFLRAALTTVWLTFVAQGVGTVAGIALAPLRMSQHAGLRAIARLYLLVFRGTPELLQLIAWYAVLPQFGVNLSIYSVAIVGLSANEAARMAEILRSGFQAVDPGQGDAARALGLSRLQTLLSVTGPQTLRIVLAGLGNEVNIMFKTTSLVSVIGLTELLRQSELTAQTAQKPLGTYLAALLYYFVLTTLWGGVQGVIMNRQDPARAGLRLWGGWWTAVSGGFGGRARWTP